MGKILYFLCFILSVFPHRCKRESKAYSCNLLERQGNEVFTPFSYKLNKQDKDMKRILTFLLVAFATIVAHAQEGVCIDKGLVNSRHETVEFDNLNHLFQHCQTGLLTEYQQIEETFASEALTKICTWIKSL